MNLPSALGGLAGACALTVLNETVKKLDKDAPRLDLLGMNAAAKLMKGVGISSLPGPAKLLPASMAGDLVTNSLYYGLAEAGNNRKTLIRGTLLGLGAGLGAVALPKSMGLDEKPTAATPKTKALTIAWYVIGGLVAASVMNLITKRA